MTGTALLMLVLAMFSCVILFSRRPPPDYEKIQIGMTYMQVRLTLDRMLLFGGGRDEIGDTWLATVDYPSDGFMPNDTIKLRFDWATNEVVEKSISRPTVNDIWNHWKRQLELWMSAPILLPMNPESLDQLGNGEVWWSVATRKPTPLGFPLPDHTRVLLAAGCSAILAEEHIVPSSCRIGQRHDRLTRLFVSPVVRNGDTVGHEQAFPSAEYSASLGF